MLKRLKEDLEVNFNTQKLAFRTKIFNNKYKFFLFFRYAQYLHEQKINNKSLVTKITFFIVYRIYKYYEFKFNVEISPTCQIDGGLYLPHLNGIIIHPLVKIGKKCSILQQVTIGNNSNKGLNNLATIGNNVSIGAGAKIIGPVTIGDNIIIGANTVVTKNIPSNKIVAGIPAEILKDNI